MIPALIVGTVVLAAAVGALSGYLSIKVFLSKVEISVDCPHSHDDGSDDGGPDPGQEEIEGAPPVHEEDAAGAELVN